MNADRACGQCGRRTATFVLDLDAFCEPCLAGEIERRIREMDEVRRSVPEIFQTAALRAQVPYMLTLDQLRRLGVLPEAEHEEYDWPISGTTP